MGITWHWPRSTSHRAIGRELEPSANGASEGTIHIAPPKGPLGGNETAQQLMHHMAPAIKRD
eukprot:5634920-Pyramimonas_sp.AAC.1